ncbi:hypothetical protein [Longimicrobium terrae]|uniref:P-type conjugative transfer protein TrbJ n=1 Tax=Longimicrobium terrae TaxID=1639882 RepID=A0A841GRZ0_9BACT|nr:hypothetical protein [Longimicrobium terrae]MBB4636026.1 hypothetical protein [Longimicrobium terrae]MBB6070422.1 hypothetical protein [Longimicrobium terrae]
MTRIRAGSVGRRLTAATLAAGLVLALHQPVGASLIPGLPSVVYDPVNYASAVARYRQLYQQARGQVRQIEYAYDQARHLRDQSRGWSQFRLADFRGVFRETGRTMGEGVALGYGNPELGNLFRQHFPRVPRVADGMRIPHADQLNSVRDLAFAAVMGAQMQGAQIGVAEQALDALRRGVTGAGTERQLQQAQAAVQTFAAEQDLLMRHTLLSLNQQLAAANAREAQRQMQDAVRGAQADGRWRAWEEAVVGAYGENLSGRDRSLDAIRRRAGVRGGPGVRGEARDPRDLGARRAQGIGWEYGPPSGGAGAGAGAGGMSGTEAGQGPREWDPTVPEEAAPPVDPWNPQAGGQPIFTQPATGGGGRTEPAEETPSHPPVGGAGAGQPGGVVQQQ